MKYELFSTVVLTRDLPEFGLKRGDVATVVEYMATVEGQEDGYVLEVFDNEGNTLDVIPVVESTIANPKPGAVVNYRDYEKAA